MPLFLGLILKKKKKKIFLFFCQDGVVISYKVVLLVLFYLFIILLFIWFWLFYMIFNCLLFLVLKLFRKIKEKILTIKEKKLIIHAKRVWLVSTYISLKYIIIINHIVISTVLSKIKCWTMLSIPYHSKSKYEKLG